LSWNYIDNEELNLSLHFYSFSGELVFNSISQIRFLKKGICKGICVIPGNFLNDGVYYISVMVVKDSTKILYNLEQAVTIEISDERDLEKWHGKWPGHVRPLLDFSITNI
jgi:lipopolysaccharide transport system ATP-binding protein